MNMPGYLQIENISKSYGTKVLFQNIAFNVNEGDKIALVAPNGTGKTSLMRILAGKDSSDSGGKVLFMKDIRIAFLEQEYSYDPEATVFEQIWNDSRQWTEHLDAEHIADYEIRIRRLLSTLGIEDASRQMKLLSGGEVKRVAIIVMLASEADFYIMDEPTNHLDVDTIEYLENYLNRARCTLLMVTHDRYFLDAVANIVMDMDRGAVHVYRGDYQNYLLKRQERIDNYNSETDKVRNLFRRELEWMHSSPCARTGKAKYRKNAFYELKARAEDAYRTESVTLEGLGQAARLGTKIINCKDLSFSYGDMRILDHFTYNFQRYEKVGIVGPNGVGKTTFVNLLLGRLAADDTGQMTGSIERGESLKVGYYSQLGMEFDESQTVLETINDTRLLGRFLFPHEMLNNRVSSLSGGEKRRLYLLSVLMQQPNFLVMDEPTNDLDIVTINILEEYLKEFKGTLILVSHDRHFLDRLVDHLFVFCGDGVVKDFIGNYSQYREYKKDYEAARKQAAKAEEAARRAAESGKDGSGGKSGSSSWKSGSGGQGSANQSGSQAVQKPRKLSYKEQRELEQLEKDIEALTAEKASLENALSGELTDREEIMKATTRFSEVAALLDEKETRWLELSM